jgi:hypothetical protein
MITMFFFIWNVLLFLSIALMFLRKDWREMFDDIFCQLLSPNFLIFIVMIFVIYIFLPLTIPYSIKNILGIKNEDK